MAEHLSMREITQWMRNLEARMGEMHGENRESNAEIKMSVDRLGELQRLQNGNVAALTSRVVVLETKQQYTDEEVDRIQVIATTAATSAAKGVMEDISPGVKRLIVIGVAIGATVGGGLVGMAKVIEIVGTLWK